MKKRASKPEEGAVRGRAAGIEQYNSNVDRRTTQTLGRSAFSAFVAVVAFLVVLGHWRPCGRRLHCVGARRGLPRGVGGHHGGAHRHGNGRKWWCSASASSPA